MRYKSVYPYLQFFAVTVSILLAWAGPLPAGPEPLSLPEPGIVVDHTRTDLTRPARPFNSSYNGPVIDTHVHLDPPRKGGVSRSALREIVEVIERSGVQYAIFMPTPNEGRMPNHSTAIKQKLLLEKTGKGRIKLFTGSSFITYWLHQAYRKGYRENELSKILNKLGDDLESGNYSGVGEIGLFHFRKSGHQMVIEYPPTFNPFITFVDLVASKGAILDLHAEPVEPEGRSREDEVFGAIELIMKRNPDLRIIISHTGMTNPVNARRILERYPKVMMNFKIFTRHRKWRNLEPTVNRNGEIYEDWAKLFELMPDRFMVGTDAKFGRVGRFTTSRYLDEIKAVRRLLGTLDRKAAEKIAYANAASLFSEGLDPSNP